MQNERILTAAEAIREATEIAMDEHPEAYLIGEGVADPGRIFGTTKGLLEKFGAARVIEQPVAENGLTGIAIGSALMNRRPIMTHQRVDFALLALEQLFNTAAKSHYVSNGHHRVPLTVRMIIGRGWGQGPQHSQALEALFAYIPGLKVVMPSTPSEFKGLFLAAVKDDNPVMFLEHRWLHYVKGHVPTGSYAIPLTGPRVARSGGRATVVATSYMVLEALKAADALERIGCPIDVIDLRVLRPLNTESIVESVRRTGHLVTCDTGWMRYGIGAEIVAGVAEKAYDSLKSAPIRLGLPDHPTPSSLILASEFYPGADHIVRAVGKQCALPEAAIEQACEEVIALRKGVPIDKPDPSFSGPF